MSLSTILLLTGILTIFICLLFGLMFSYYFLLKRISISFPKYYLALGSPFLPTASWSIRKTIARDNHNYKLLAKLFVGLPSNFPKEARVRRLAAYIRFEMFAIVMLVGIGVGCVLASSI